MTKRAKRAPHEPKEAAPAPGKTPDKRQGTFGALPYRATFHYAGDKVIKAGRYLKVGTEHATDLTTHRLRRFEADTPVETS